MRLLALTSILSLLLCLQLGCSAEHIRFRTRSGSSLKDRPSGLLMDANNTPFLIELIERPDGSLDFVRQISGRIVQKETCRAEYHKLYSTNHFIVVEGQIGKAEAKYPIVLDTGASQPVFVKVGHVLDNRLPIYPLENNKAGLNGHGLGLCYLPELQIGNVTFADWPSFYLEQSGRRGLFGLAVTSNGSEDNTVIVGLPVLREFRYIVFDSISKQVIFSSNESFEAKEPGLWEKFPFSIEEDFHRNAFLLVEVSVAGEAIELQLDTGSGRGLAIGEQLWESLRQRMPDVKLNRGRELYPYIGLLPCRRGEIAELRIGQRAVRNAQISVFANDSPLLQGCQGLLGMQCFQNAVMVLDFERNLMWVSSSQP